MLTSARDQKATYPRTATSLVIFIVSLLWIWDLTRQVPRPYIYGREKLLTVCQGRIYTALFFENSPQPNRAT